MYWYWPRTTVITDGLQRMIRGFRKLRLRTPNLTHQAPCVVEDFPALCTSLCCAHYHASSATAFNTGYLNNHGSYWRSDRISEIVRSITNSWGSQRFNVNRSTLGKRFQGKTGSLAKRAESNQLLSNKQELVLVEHIRRLSEWCLPPTPAMVTL
jgi:hypothetical protein